MTLKNNYASPGRITYGVIGWKPENGLTIIERFETMEEAMAAAEKHANENTTWAHIYEMKYVNTFDIDVITKQRFK